MTCPCYDPVVFGHLNCDRHETQPHARLSSATAPWTTVHVRNTASSAQALSEALRVTWNYQQGGVIRGQPPQTGENP